MKHFFKRSTTRSNITPQEISTVPKEHSVWSYILYGIIFVQLGLLFVFNLTRLPYSAGFDSSAAMAQAMEIYRQKTIFLSKWSYQATLGLDSVLLLASLFYGITKNIFLAYGLADCIGVLLCLFLFHDIFCQLQVKKNARLFTYAMILTPYSLEPLGYMPMLFTGAAYYIIKALLPLMLIDCILHIKAHHPVRQWIITAIFCMIFLYLTGFSCGLYLFMCGLFPIFLYELWVMLAKNDKKIFLSWQTLFLCLGLIAFAGGYGTAILYDADTYTSSMIFAQVDTILNNIGRCIIGIAELFGGLPYRKITITSAYGIHYLSHLTACLLFVIVLGIGIKKIKPIHAALQEETLSPKQTAAGLALSVILINLLILFLTDTNYGSDSFEFRYHIIPVMCGMVLFGIGLEYVLDFLHTPRFSLLYRLVLLVITSVVILCNVVYVNYYQYTNRRDTTLEIRDYVRNEMSCHMVYFIGSDEDLLEISRLMRLYDTDMIAFDGHPFGHFTGWGASTTYYATSAFDSTIAIVCKSGDLDDLLAKEDDAENVTDEDNEADNVTDEDNEADNVTGEDNEADNVTGEDNEADNVTGEDDEEEEESLFFGTLTLHTQIDDYDIFLWTQD